jgi:hypothetical protein
MVCLGIKAQIPWTYTPYYSSWNVNVSTGNYFINADYITLGNGNYNISASANVDAIARTEIHMQPGFQVSNLAVNGLGHFHSGQLDVASFHPNGFLNISQFSRFELGIKLSAYLQARIDTFIGTYSGPLKGLNPYDPDAIKIMCIYTDANGIQYKRNGFYYQPYSVTNNNKTFTPGSTVYPFRIRFAPPVAGAYQCKIQVILNNTDLVTEAGVQFMVDPSSSHGHLALDPVLERMKFQDGTPFFGIGQNLTVGIDDPAYNTLFPYPDGDYKGKISPRNFDKNRNQLIDLAQKGGNFVRLRLDPCNFPLEYADYRYGVPNYAPDRCITNFHHNQMFLQEFDSTLAVCENKNVYIMLNIFLLDQISNTNNGTLHWSDFPYSAAFNLPADNNAKATDYSVHEFVTNAQIKATFKKQLYYIDARWGYSTSIAMWEMINETEATMYYETPTSTSYPYIANEVNNWICEMAGYLKTFEPVHLTTNGTINHGSAQNTLNQHCLDIYSTNDYNEEIVTNPALNFYGDYHYNWKDNLHEGGKNAFHQHMPFVHGELGLGIGCADTSYHEQWQFTNNYNDRSFHNTLWSTAMAGNVATGLTYFDPDQDNVDHRGNYKALSRFSNMIRWDKQLVPKRYSNNYGANVTHGTGPSNPGNTHYLYNMFMVDSATHRYAVGWSMIHPSFWVYDQNTTNYQNLLSCEGYNPGNLIDYDVSSNLGDAPVVITNMVPNQPYKILIFDPYDETAPILTANLFSDNFGIIPFHIKFFNHRDANPNKIGPDRAYIIGLPGDIDNAIGHEPQSPTDDVKQYASDMNNNMYASYRAFLPVQQITDPSTRNVSVFPTPASEYVFMDYNDKDFANAAITISDLAGKTIRQEAASKKIYVGNLEQGMYILSFKAEGFEKTFKMIIER